MRKIFVTIFGAAALLLPLHANAESGEADATITKVKVEAQAIVLDDGKTYTAPAEFDYEGLEPGVKVVIYYTVSGDKRVIDDLVVDQ